MVLPTTYPQLDARIKVELHRVRSAQDIFSNVTQACHVERWDDVSDHDRTVCGRVPATNGIKVLKASTTLNRRLDLYGPQWAMYSRTWSRNEKLLLASGLWEELRDVHYRLKALRDCLFDEVMQREAQHQLDQRHSGDRRESPQGDDAYVMLARALCGVEDLLISVKDDGPLEEKTFDVEVAYVLDRH
jgi:hypothetical protein